MIIMIFQLETLAATRSRGELHTAVHLLRLTQAAARCHFHVRSPFEVAIRTPLCAATVAVSDYSYSEMIKDAVANRGAGETGSGGISPNRCRYSFAEASDVRMKGCTALRRVFEHRRERDCLVVVDGIQYLYQTTVQSALRAQEDGFFKLGGAWNR